MHLGFEIWGILGRVWPTEWHTHYCERFEPRSHFKSMLSLIVRVNVVTVNNNSPIQDYVHPDDQTQPTRYCSHYFNINLSPSRCFPLNCLFQAMAWIGAIDSVTHYVLLLQNVSLNATVACRCINWLTHQWKKLDLIKRSRCDQRFYFNVILPFLT